MMADGGPRARAPLSAFVEGLLLDFVLKACPPTSCILFIRSDLSAAEQPRAARSFSHA